VVALVSSLLLLPCPLIYRLLLNNMRSTLQFCLLQALHLHCSLLLLLPTLHWVTCARVLLHPQVSISERVHALEDHVAECEKTMGIKVKDLRDLNDALANKQAEYAKYEAAADKKSQELQGTIDTTVRATTRGRQRR